MVYTNGHRHRRPPRFSNVFTAESAEVYQDKSGCRAIARGSR